MKESTPMNMTPFSHAVRADTWAAKKREPQVLYLAQSRHITSLDNFCHFPADNSNDSYT